MRKTIRLMEVLGSDHGHNEEGRLGHGAPQSSPLGGRPRRRYEPFTDPLGIHPATVRAASSFSAAQRILLQPMRAKWGCGQLSSRDLALHLPASAEVPVDIDQSDKLVQLGLGKPELRVERICLVGEDFEITRGAAPIPHLRKPGSVLRSDD